GHEGLPRFPGPPRRGQRECCGLRSRRTPARPDRGTASSSYYLALVLAILQNRGAEIQKPLEEGILRPNARREGVDLRDSLDELVALKREHLDAVARSLKIDREILPGLRLADAVLDPP